MDILGGPMSCWGMFASENDLGWWVGAEGLVISPDSKPGGCSFASFLATCIVCTPCWICIGPVNF